MKLPPLPALDTWGAGHVIRMDEAQRLMRAYGEACALMAREEAAKVCDRIAVNYRRDQPNDPSGFLTAEECAAAIRKG